MTDADKGLFIDWITAQHSAGVIYQSEEEALGDWRSAMPIPTGYSRKNPWDVMVTINRPT